MEKNFFSKSGKIGFADPSYYYILMAAGLIFLYASFRSYTQAFYECCSMVPCVLFLGAQQERRRNLEDRKRFLLPGAMVVWFLLLQGKRGIEHADLDNIGLFLSVYLFAFPMASLMQDGNKKKALRIFAGAYLAAAAVLSVDGLLLILDCLPAFLAEYVFWDGGRIAIFWHSNIVACFLMIGIVFCTTFWAHVKSLWSKMSLSLLLALMIGILMLTSCRTAIILTGGYLGSIFFFMMVRHGRKWFIPGVLVVLVVTVVFYGGAIRLYQANYDMLIKKYTQQYSEQIAYDASDFSAVETDIPSAETAEPQEITYAAEDELVNAESAQKNIPAEEIYNEEDFYEEDFYEEDYYEEDYYEEEESDDSQEERIPIEVDPDTGEVYLTTSSQQGAISSDFGTLNSRTYIWSAAKFAIRETPSILYWGIHNPGWYVSYYNFFPIAHLHNAWMQCLVGMGLVGFLIAMLFTLMTVWNCLIILLKHYQDIWKRNVALLALCLLVAAVLEPYLFYTSVSYHLTDFLFFLCAGYLAHWQEADNRDFLVMIISKISFLNK